jgi:ATP synthase F1 delta subunit
MPLIDAPADALASIYAHSILDVAESKGGRPEIETVLGELEDILELARANPKFSEFLASRVLSADDREASLRRIFGSAVNPVTLQFLLLLNHKNRLSHLIPIVAALDSHVQARFGRVEVDVFTADPMSPDEVKHVRERLASALGKEVIVHPYTDGTMIGGIKFRIGDQLIDGSLATRLRKLKDQLATGGSASLRAKIERMFDK